MLSHDVTLIAIELLLFTFLRPFSSAEGPPRMRDAVQKDFHVLLGSGDGMLFSLTCPTVDEHEADQRQPKKKSGGTMVKWTKDGGEVPFDPDASQYRPLKTNRVLQIRLPTLEDSGRYACLAVNGYGHQTATFNVEFYDSRQIGEESDSIVLSDLPSSPLWQDRVKMEAESSRTIRLRSGSRLELRCPGRGNPLPMLSWFKDGVPLMPGEVTSPRSAKLIVEKVGSDDGGTYSCRMKNAYGSLEADFLVSVFESGDSEISSRSGKGLHAAFPAAYDHSAGDPSFAAPTIDSPYNASVRRGHTAKFQCAVLGQGPAPTIKWLRRVDEQTLQREQSSPNATILHLGDLHLLMLEKDGMVTLSNTTDADNRPLFVNQLTIRSVQADSAGHYFCVVSDLAGHFSYRSVRLHVVEGLQFSSLIETPNVIIAVCLAVVLVLAIAAISWLCWNGGRANSILEFTSATSSANTSTTSTLPSGDMGDFGKEGGVFEAPFIPIPPCTRPPPPPRLPPPIVPERSARATSPNRAQQKQPYSSNVEALTRGNSCHTTPQLRQKTCFTPHAVLSDKFSEHARVMPQGSEGFLHFYTLDRRHQPRHYSTHRHLGAACVQWSGNEDKTSGISSNTYGQLARAEDLTYQSVLHVSQSGFGSNSASRSLIPKSDDDGEQPFADDLRQTAAVIDDR